MVQSFPLHSMTGFGEQTATCAGLLLTVRIRTVNHKGFDPRCRLPQDLMSLESGVLAHLRSRIDRGHVDLAVLLQSEAEQFDANIQVSSAAMEAYRNLWKQVTGGDEAPGEWLLQQDGVWRRERARVDPAEVEGPLFELLDCVLDEVLEGRRAEGQNLTSELLGRLILLQGLVSQIRVLGQDCISRQQESLRMRIRELGIVPGDKTDEALVLIADRADVEEELTRLESHISQFMKTLKGASRGPHGKRLGFLAQELMREATTIASKAGNAEIAGLSVDARVEIERIREQLMNIE